MKSRVGYLFYIGIVGGLALAVGLVFLEIILQKEAVESESETQFQYTWRQNRHDYGGFVQSELHPRYWFMMRHDEAFRSSRNNDTVSVTAEGYRGPGPEARQDRQLGFVLGGSTAFGQGSSSDATTIAGYLNCLQDEIFFVNAGHPSWVAQQEMLRLIYQIRPQAPTVVLAYSGFNDVINTFRQPTQPPGTSENFPRLVSAVTPKEDAVTPKEDVGFWLKRTIKELLPQTIALIKGALRHNSDAAEGITPHEPATTAIEKDAEWARLGRDAAENFLDVQRVMRGIVEEAGGRHFVAVQPFYLHDAAGRVIQDTIGPRNHVDFASSLERWQRGYEGMVTAYDAFDSVVQDESQTDPQFISQSGLFPRAAESLKGDADLALGDFYVDVVHFSDLGAYVAARDVVERLLVPNGLVDAAFSDACPQPAPL